jgi:hypothetical protein
MIRQTVVVIFIMIGFLLLLAILRTEQFKEFRQDVQCGDARPIPYDSNTTYALCEKCCAREVDLKYSNASEPHGWKPFALWNNRWTTTTEWNKQKTQTEHKLYCNCNMYT